MKGGAPERVIAFLGACRDRGVIWNGVPAAAAVAAPPGPCSIFQYVLASQNSKNGHKPGLEKAPETFKHLFMQEISRSIDPPHLEGLKRLLFQSYDFSIGVGVSRFDNMSGEI